MAQHFDLEEQEQLDQIKHFWKEWGNLITWLLIAVFGSIAAYNGWQYWQRTQSAQASAIFDEVDRAAAAGDVAQVERAYTDAKEKFGKTAFAHQSALLAARVFEEKGKDEQAKAALSWVAADAPDEGYKAVARLRLAAILVQAKAYDEALKQLDAGMPKSFEALAFDRRGDIFNLQGKKAEARSAYTQAYKAMEANDYRRLVEVKLSALGVDPKDLAPAPAAAASTAAKS